MAVTKLNDPVLYHGKQTTIAELDAQNLIEYEECDNFMTRSGKRTTKYFANIKGTNSGWEIGKMAYYSRTGQKAPLNETFVVNGITISNDAIRAYNRKAQVLFNDGWNTAHRLGTLQEHRILREIDWWANAEMTNKITKEDIKQYLKHQERKQAQG